MKPPEEKKERRRYFRKRWILYALCAAFVALAILDWHCETDGVPGFVSARITKSLAARGVGFHARSIRCGVVNGAVLDDVGIELGPLWEAPSLKAEKIIASASLRELLRGNFIPVAFQIVNGRFEAPVFPESGEEGAGDRIVISDFNAVVGGHPGRLLVRKANGRLQGFEFKMSGSVEGLFLAAGAKGGEALRESLTPAAQDAPPPLAAAPQASRTSGFASNVPLQFRKRLMRALARLKAEEFSEPPKCEVRFAADLSDYRRSSMRAKVSLPAFEYGRLKISPIKEEFSLKDGVIGFEGLHIDLGPGEALEAKGAYDTIRNSVSGEVSGLCSPDKLLLFLDESARRSLASEIGFGEGLVSFNGHLQSFALAGSSYQGGAEVKIPQLRFHGAKFSDVSGFVMLDGRTVKGKLLGATPGGGGELEGEFSVSGDSFECDVEGSAQLASLKPFLSPDAKDFIDANVELMEPEDGIPFSGSLRSSRWQDGAFEGAFNLLASGVKFKGIEMKRLSAGFSFGGGLIRADGVEATLDDGTKLSGEMLCIPKKGSFSASLFCIGSPERALCLLGPEHRSFLESIVKDIDWPLAGNLVESSIDIHATSGAKPFCFMTGSLVMTDFEYRGVKFKYGATRFMIDSDKLLVLPGAILETADGQALMSIAYRGAGGRVGAGTGGAASPGGRLNFSLESAMSGNDLLRCLYPQWKSEFVDFPKSVEVSAKGAIDYRSPDASRFTAKIDNGSCVWKGVPVSDLDAVVSYGGRRLSLKGASAEICDGRLDIDYGFDFKSMSGDVAAKMRNADLQPLLKLLGWGGLVGDGKAGRLSGELKSKLSYDKDGLLLMDGKGKIGVGGADLWSIPLFGDFLTFLGKAWSLKSLGSITTADCEFNLVGDRLTTDSFKSDGGVVALSAKGDYLWNTNEFDFKFRAELLKGALPFETMSALLSPVSWMLERRLHGKDKSFKWD